MIPTKDFLRSRHEDALGRFDIDPVSADAAGHSIYNIGISRDQQISLEKNNAAKRMSLRGLPVLSLERLKAAQLSERVNQSQSSRSMAKRRSTMVPTAKGLSTQAASLSLRNGVKRKGSMKTFVERDGKRAHLESGALKSKALLSTETPKVPAGVAKQGTRVTIKVAALSEVFEKNANASP